MVKYQRRETNVNKILEGKEPILIHTPAVLMEVLPQVDLGKEVLRIKCPILNEEFYLSGDQEPFNTYYKRAPTVRLDQYDSQEEANGAARPFYRQRRDAFAKLHNERKRRLRQGDNGFIYRSGLSWRQGGWHEALRVMPIVAADEGLDGLMAEYDSKSPFEITHVSLEYAPEQARKQGVIIWFGTPSVSGKGKYIMQENALHNVPIFNDPRMYSIIAEIKSTHNCGYKQNLRTRFGGRNRPIDVEPLCQHDVKAFLKFLIAYQARFRTGENIDSVYDPLERKMATVPMFLNPVPLADKNELHDSRVLQRNSTITRPKRDRKKGGFLRDSKGDIIYDEEKPLWEAEIEAVTWTLIADKGKDARFPRHRMIG